MAKLHYCDDGITVTNKVLRYQTTRSNDDYLPIHKYYDNYKDRWYLELKDFLDRSTFDSEFDFKLCRAIQSFDGEQAQALCDKYKYSFLGEFNRWFYAVLRNWKSNVKTSAFRQKKRPSVHCPVCGRKVPKIDETHLAHYKGRSDLPKAFFWKGIIYQVVVVPGAFAISWGKYSKKKLEEINNGNAKSYKRERAEWPWYTRQGRRGVMCPFTKKILSEITIEHIQSLPNEYSRYARPISWQEFVEEYPYPVLIQAETYSLDYNQADEDLTLHGNVAVNNPTDVLGHEDVAKNRVTMEYEHIFYLIEKYVEDETDQKVLKLAAIGYSDEDIAQALDLDRKEVRSRKRNIKSAGADLKEKLLDSV